MNRRTKIAIAAAATVGVVAAGTGGALAATGDDGDDRDDRQEALSGEELDRASAAALEHTGGGRVTDSEREDEESLFEIEVTLDDGREVDVQLDERYRVVGTEEDRRDSDDDSREADDAREGDERGENDD